MNTEHSEAETTGTFKNLPRYFVEQRVVAMVLLVGVLVWGVFSYFTMPRRKDPDIPVRVALAVVVWPGASADKIEDLVTRKLETKIAENPKIEKLDSNTRNSVTVVTITMRDEVNEIAKELDDLQLKLASLNGELPAGASPIQFVKDFGDTTNLMLTITRFCSAAAEQPFRHRNQGPASARSRYVGSRPAAFAIV